MRWFRLNLKTDGDLLLGEQMEEFANKHGLSPGQILITSQNRIDEVLHTHIIYWAEKPIEDLFGSK